MKIIRKVGLALAGVVLLAALFVPPAAKAGTTDSPEVSDPSGDVSKRSWDITEAWFGPEANATLDVTMNTSALDSYTNPQQIPNLPIAEYEVYFTAGNSSYSVACRVPVHGPLYFTIAFELRTVTYGNGTGNIQEASSKTLSGCSYNPGNHTIHWVLNKADVGSPAPGSRLTKTWAAVWNQDRGQTNRTLEDRAPNSGYGQDYVIRGSAGAEIIEVLLSADNSTQPVSPVQEANYRLTIFNNGTSTVNVLLRNSTMSPGWGLEFSLDYLTIYTNTSRFVSIKVSCPRDAKNGTVEITRVWATVNTTTSNQTGVSKNTVILTTTVSYLPPAPEAEGPFTSFIKMLSNYYMVLIIVTVVVIVIGAAAWGAARRNRRRKALLGLEATPPAMAAK